MYTPVALADCKRSSSPSENFLGDKAERERERERESERKGKRGIENMGYT